MEPRSDGKELDAYQRDFHIPKDKYYHVTYEYSSLIRSDELPYRSVNKVGILFIVIFYFSVQLRCLN